MSDRTSTLTAVLIDSVSGPAKKIQGEITNIGTTVSHVGSILSGIGVGIGIQVFDTLEKGISQLAEVIPNLIQSGNAYLEQLHNIQLETGMTAEQTSLLVGTFKALNVPTDTITTLFAQLSQHLQTNEGLFAQLGIATRNSKNEQLSFAQILENVRQAFVAHGSSLASTAAATELFGRGAKQILEVLQASDPVWKQAEENVRRWGGVVSQQAIDGATAFGRTLASLQQGITDVGVNIAAAVDPYLRAFVDSFSTFVQSHLNEIVQFAVTVVNVITGFLSGLFGITDALTVTSNTAAEAGGKQTAWVNNLADNFKKAQAESDAFTKSVKGQIKAIDDHTHALQVAAERRRAIQERARLTDSLAAAQAQLADLRGSAPFLGGGLSAAEQTLAVQKHAQDIIDAEKDVRDKRQALGNFEADQKDRAEAELLSREKQRLQDLLAAQKVTDKARLDSFNTALQGADAASQVAFGNMGINVANFGKQAASSFQVGIDAASAFLDILLGTQHRATDRGEGLFRTGGVIGALKDVGNAFVGAAGVLGQVADFIHNLFTINPIRTLIDNPIGPTSSTRAPKQDYRHAQGGWVGLHGPEMGIVGEEGPEYIIPHGGTAPGGQTVHMHFDFLSMPSDAQLRSLTDQVSRRLAFELNHSPVTSKPYGSF